MSARKVKAWWDDQDPACAGWYAESLDAEGRLIDDSMKVWLGVDLDRFRRDQADEVRRALAAAFPRAEIDVIEEG